MFARSPTSPVNRSYRSYLDLFPRSHPAWQARKISARALRAHGEQLFSGRLLDIGCGNKSKALLLGDLVSEYVGLDHKDSQHEQTDVDLFGTAYDIPVPDDSFDCILCTAVLEHLEEPADALAEAYRVLKPGGVAMYTVPLFWHVHEAPRDFFRYTRFGLEHLFGKVGFDIKEITALSGFLTTFSAETGYYLQRFRRGLVRPIVDLLVRAGTGLCARLDQGYCAMSPLRGSTSSWSASPVATAPSNRYPRELRHLSALARSQCEACADIA